MLLTHRTARALAVLAAGLLAASLTQGPVPAGAGSAGDAPAGSRGGGPEAQAIADPRGDSRVERGAGRRLGALADLTRVVYRTPFRVGGDLRITTRWADLRNGSRRGVRSQSLRTELLAVGSNGSWTVHLDNTPGHRVVIEDFTSDEETTIVHPRRVTVDRTYGRGGQLEVVLSTEWMTGVERVRLRTTSNYWSETAVDSTAGSRTLAFGQPR